MSSEDKDFSVAPVVGPGDPRRFTDSGIAVEPLYTAEDVADGLAEPQATSAVARAATTAARRVLDDEIGFTAMVTTLPLDHWSGPDARATEHTAQP